MRFAHVMRSELSGLLLFSRRVPNQLSPLRQFGNGLESRSKDANGNRWQEIELFLRGIVGK